MKNSKFMTAGVIVLGTLLFMASADSGQEDSGIWMSYNEALSKAEELKEPIMLFVEAEWCLHCQTMKEETFSRQEIGKILKNNYHPVRIDIDASRKVTFRGGEVTHRELARSLNVQTTPATFFLNHEEEIIGSRAGYMDTETVELLLSFVISEEFGSVSFQEYRQNR